MKRREFTIFITFSDTCTCTYVVYKVWADSDQNCIFTNFLSCSKIGSKSLYYSTGSWAKFHQKQQWENSPFLLHFLIHIHVILLCRKFKLILRFFRNFKFASKFYQGLWAVFLWKMRQLSFLSFSDTYIVFKLAQTFRARALSVRICPFLDKPPKVSFIWKYLYICNPCRKFDYKLLIFITPGRRQTLCMSCS